jgi:hypothetical protein
MGMGACYCGWCEQLGWLVAVSCVQVAAAVVVAGQDAVVFAK